jgi:hypothetical protein
MILLFLTELSVKIYKKRVQLEVLLQIALLKRYWKRTIANTIYTFYLRYKRYWNIFEFYIQIFGTLFLLIEAEMLKYDVHLY